MLKNRRLFATAIRDYSWLFVTIRDYSEFSQTLKNYKTRQYSVRDYSWLFLVETNSLKTTQKGNILLFKLIKNCSL